MVEYRKDIKVIFGTDHKAQYTILKYHDSDYKIVSWDYADWPEFKKLNKALEYLRIYILDRYKEKKRYLYNELQFVKKQFKEFKNKNKPDNHIIDYFLDISDGEIKHYSRLIKWNGREFVPYDFQKKKKQGGDEYV